MIVIIQHTVKIINLDGKLAFRTDLLFSRDGQDAEHLWLSYAPDALHPEHRGVEYYNASSITKNPHRVTIVHPCGDFQFR